jgi:bifunctional NMN adenylyltransferase/nudix hydrolase
MQERSEQYDVGVLVGRFQVNALHSGHIELLEHVCKRHDKTIIVLGLSPVTPSLTNPLDFESRKQMILDAFPNVLVLYVKDMHDDDLWSRQLDNLVRDHTLGHRQTAVLYGGRDSFIDHYTGTLPTIELMQSEFWSGTAVRKQIARSSSRASADFRAGVIWAMSAKYPTAFQTVDVAIMDEGKQRILLGRKPAEKQFRLIGGFSEPTSPSLEADVRKEVMEEAFVEISDPKYVGSMVVDDWRFRGESDKIKTALFEATYLFGHPTPGDDIEEVRWFDFPCKRADIVPAHVPVLGMLYLHYQKESMR